MIRTAVVAYGFSSSTFHIPFIQADPNFQLTSIVTSKVDAVKLEFPECHVVPDLSFLDPGQIELVVITSPNRLHYEQVHFCLSLGLHVVVEKPFVLASDEAVELAKLAAEKGVQVVVFQNRRWDGDFLTLRSLMDSGAVGDVKRLTSRFDRFRPVVRERWREQPGAGAGILWDLGPHLLDQAVCLFGRPSAIQANVSALREGADVDDNFEIWLEYPDKQVHLGSSSFQPGPNNRFSLEGTGGSYLKYGLDVQEQDLKNGADVLDDRWGQESEDSWGILYQESGSKLVPTKPGNYGVFWHQLGQAILESAQAPVPIAESIQVIKLIELAFESSRLGKKLIVQGD